MSGAWRHDLIPVLSLIGVMLDALGGLYLAYDLLGGKRGPLRMINKSVSYGVMFGSIYGLPLGVWFGLAGLLVSGPALPASSCVEETAPAQSAFDRRYGAKSALQSSGVTRAAVVRNSGRYFSRGPSFDKAQVFQE